MILGTPVIASCQVSVDARVHGTFKIVALTAVHDYNYKWCKKVNGNWDYCCEDECSNSRCSPGDGHTQQYCSPLITETVNGKLLFVGPGIILCIRPANERRRYNVTSSLNVWAHTQNDVTSSLISWVHTLYVGHFISCPLYHHGFTSGAPFYTPVWKTGRIMPWQCPSVRPSAFSGLFFNMLWDINLKLGQ